jgi:serine/threonine-protein kinase
VLVPAVAASLAEALHDRYEIERELGRGGTATVYLAHDLRHARLVALKLFRHELATLGPERFLREIRTTARLQHPNILPVYDSGEAARQLWYTMPFVEGESLRRRLQREVRLPIKEAVRLARDVADALDYAHSQGIVHRDIKPENILLSRGHALVADFGVAKAVQAGGEKRLTPTTGMAVGTAAYMSPEQASGDRVDACSDVYALGCVLYEMLAGEPPFTGRSALAIVVRRWTEPPPRVRERRAEIPEAIDEALNRALAQAPTDRFPTAAAFAEALETAP